MDMKHVLIDVIISMTTHKHLYCKKAGLGYI